MPGPIAKRFEDWENAWATNRTGWHKSHVNTNLKDNIEFLTDGKKACKILVPFCGKTLDLLWLVENGHSVIGVELIQKAVDDFFQENKISYKVKTVEDYQCFETFDGKLTIFVGDYFKFSSLLIGGKVDGIWDCNALGALVPSYWDRHLKTSLELLDPSHGRILMQAFLYDDKAHPAGPPCSVSQEELKRRLGNEYEIQLLSKESDEVARERFKKPWLYVCVTGIKRNVSA
ncbi:probable thiopurine S-methyltransferase isoform X2 [Xenia sp. Carnegie-2017]|uniref:probable thiopurine S-methyltransferase isoform X2 n=1 Tax=Xenia sp. Carnegie-2017 TaxID=2897299 RepID=UPI001F042E2E|nr:probable thiopurine S-methyltransferase isoform X2 [Xenia sp. Carnegie-2017]